jgi:hypothetical protein
VVAEGRKDLAGVRRVEDRQGHTGGAGDHLGCEGRTAHPGKGNPGDPGLGEGRPQCEDLRNEGPGVSNRFGPAEALGCFGFGLRAPQCGIEGRDSGGDEVGNEGGDGTACCVGGSAGHRDTEAHSAASASALAFLGVAFAASRATVTVSRSSFHEMMNFATPSASRTWVTST